MADDVTNELLLEHLKRIQERLGRVERGQSDIMTELRAHKPLLGALVSQEAVQDGRVADLTERIERIERRLDLRETN
jgi:hypothetical protein